MVPEPALVERFRKDLDALIARDARIGIGVSGGPDSLALLLLAATARPGQIEAATVDHRLRPESADEANMVARLCEQLGVPHAIISANWNDKPMTAVQERARRERYRLLGFWAEERGLDAIATAHHADDQVETLLMRLTRGAGVRGLAGMRPNSRTPGSDVRLVRPLLGWRRAELSEICRVAGIAPAVDPSNEDEQFERVRIRRRLAENEWLDAPAIARSARHLADAQTALEWAARREWKQAVRERSDLIAYQPSDAPSEVVRRIVARAVSRLATEGDPDLRGSELDRLLEALRQGEASTLRGVRCEGGREWHFTTAPARRGIVRGGLFRATEGFIMRNWVGCGRAGWSRCKALAPCRRGSSNGQCRRCAAQCVLDAIRQERAQAVLATRLVARKMRTSSTTSASAGR